MVYAVALSGNIASGKSTVAAFFAQLGIEVIDADQVSKALTAKNTWAYQKMVEHFGTEILLSNQELDRKRLRAIIFSDSKERVWLEQLLHPLIRQELERRVALCTTPYCLIEIPLLFDRKDYPYINRVLVITAPQKVQISRIMERDHCSEEQALHILKSQADPMLYGQLANDLIVNDSGLAELKQSLEQLHLQYIQEAQGFFNSKHDIK